jgi:hypothetical protein
MQGDFCNGIAGAVRHAETGKARGKVVITV